MKKKAARTVICPCREASDATCTENRAVRATTSTTTELIVAEACWKLLAKNTKFRKKMRFRAFLIPIPVFFEAPISPSPP
jgi:hypothetical protein